MFDREKHWDTVSLGIVTLATAALAAVIVVAGFSQAGAQFVEGAPRHLVYWRLAVAGIAIAFYLGLALAVLGGVFMARGAGGARLSRKYRLAFASYLLFILQVIALAVLVVVNVSIDRSVAVAGADNTDDQDTASECMAPFQDDCCIRILVSDGVVRRYCPSD